MDIEIPKAQHLNFGRHIESKARELGVFAKDGGTPTRTASIDI